MLFSFLRQSPILGTRYRTVLFPKYADAFLMMYQTAAVGIFTNIGAFGGFCHGNPVSLERVQSGDFGMEKARKRPVFRHLRTFSRWQGQKDLKKQFRLLPCFIACFCVVFGTLCNVIRTAEQSITKPECPNLRQILDRYSLLCNHHPIWFITFIRSSEKGEYFFHLYKTLFLIAHNFLHTILTI